jgi:Mrp family chromosome partitioning ATPase
MEVFKRTAGMKEKAAWRRRGNGSAPLPAGREIDGLVGTWRRKSESQPLSTEEVLRFAPIREALRHVYDRILADCPTEGGGIFAVTSAVGGEGKTVVAVALAQLMADDLEKEVVIIDANFRGPQLHDILGVPLSPGLAGCIRLECGVEEATSRIGRLSVLPAGEEPNPARLARSGVARAVMDQVRKSFDITIVDLPSILTASEASVMSDWADGLVMVVRADSTPAPAVASAIESVPEGKLLGVVLNQQRSFIPGWLDKLL